MAMCSFQKKECEQDKKNKKSLHSGTTLKLALELGLLSVDDSETAFFSVRQSS